VAGGCQAVCAGIFKNAGENNFKTSLLGWQAEVFSQGVHLNALTAGVV
jgi:hypothetical protein